MKTTPAALPFRMAIDQPEEGHDSVSLGTPGERERKTGPAAGPVLKGSTILRDATCTERQRSRFLPVIFSERFALTRQGARRCRKPRNCAVVAMVGFVCCCALIRRGQATAPPRPLMNSRRIIRSPRRRERSKRAGT
jgi:hypothetical protein